MRKKDVKIGERYMAKISGKVIPVRIKNESPHGGWVGVNTVTKREVRIKTAAKLRGREGAPIGFSITKKKQQADKPAEVTPEKQKFIDYWMGVFRDKFARGYSYALVGRQEVELIDVINRSPDLAIDEKHEFSDKLSLAVIPAP